MNTNQLASVWNERQAFLKEKIEELQQQEGVIVNSLEGCKPTVVALKRIELAELSLGVFSYQLILSDLSKELLNLKSDNYINDARKTIYKAIIYLEEVVSPYVDVPYADYEDNLKLIAGFSDKDRLQLCNKLALSVQILINALGENSKWKWSYVELRGRYAAILKNFIDLRKYMGEMDPSSVGYQERFLMVAKVKPLFMQVANSYREKYELTTQQLDDMQAAISYLNALKRIHNLLGEPEEGQEIKKKIDVWATKMENDSRKHEKNELLQKKNKSADNLKKKNFLGF